ADLVLVKVGEPWELSALAESLQERGIPSQIDAYPPGGSIAGSRAGSRAAPARLGIYVGRGDVDAVREYAVEFAPTESAGRAGGAPARGGAAPGDGRRGRMVRPRVPGEGRGSGALTRARAPLPADLRPREPRADPRLDARQGVPAREAVLRAPAERLLAD